MIFSNSLKNISKIGVGDIIANGIINAVIDVGIKIPIVVRLEGTNVELGKETINDSKLNIISADSLTDAANKAVEIANGK